MHNFCLIFGGRLTNSFTLIMIQWQPSDSDVMTLPVSWPAYQETPLWNIWSHREDDRTRIECEARAHIWPPAYWKVQTCNNHRSRSIRIPSDSLYTYTNKNWYMQGRVFPSYTFKNMKGKRVLLITWFFTSYVNTWT